MSEKLKPCPFCGSPAEMKKNYGKWVVSCTSEADCCGQVEIGGDGLNGWESPTFAESAWNERVHSKWRTAGMSDGELIARSVIDMRPEDTMSLLDVGDEWSAASARMVKDELDRRAALRSAPKDGG